MPLRRKNQVLCTAKVHRFGKLGLCIRNRRHDRGAVHHDIGLHAGDEPGDRIGVGQITGLEANVGRDSIGADVGGNDFHPAPGQCPDHVAAHLARSPRQ